MASYSSRKAATTAQISQSRSQVNQSTDTLGRTEVRLPFDARIGAVFVEKGEFINETFHSKEGLKESNPNCAAPYWEAFG